MEKSQPFVCDILDKKKQQKQQAAPRLFCGVEMVEDSLVQSIN